MNYLIGDLDKFNLELARHLDLRFIRLDTRRHKDRELTPRIQIPKNSLKGENVVLCLRKTPKAKPNDYLTKFLLTAGALHKAGAEVTAVMPYLIYSRQDKDCIEEGAVEPISIEIMLESLSPYVNELITFNAHFEREQKVISNYAVPIHNLNAFPVFDETLKGIDSLFIMSPDKGMKEFGERLAKQYGAEFDYLEKERDAAGSASFTEKDLDVEGYRVVEIDDMVSTGGTMVKSIAHIKEYNPISVSTMFPHPAFTPGAYAKLEEVCQEMLFADTLKIRSTHSILDLLSGYITSQGLID